MGVVEKLPNSITLETKPPVRNQKQKNQVFGDSERRHKDFEKKRIWSLHLSSRIWITSNSINISVPSFVWKQPQNCSQFILLFSNKNNQSKNKNQICNICSGHFHHSSLFLLWLVLTFCLCLFVQLFGDLIVPFHNLGQQQKQALTLILVHKLLSMTRLCWSLSKCSDNCFLIVNLIMHNKEGNNTLDKWICKCYCPFTSFVCDTCGFKRGKREICCWWGINVRRLTHLHPKLKLSNWISLVKPNAVIQLHTRHKRVWTNTDKCKAAEKRGLFWEKVSIFQLRIKM